MKLNNTEQSNWLDPRGLHNAYGISRSNQATLRSKRRIPYHKRGGHIRYKISDIEAWLDESKVV